MSERCYRCGVRLDDSPRPLQVYIGAGLHETHLAAVLCRGCVDILHLWLRGAK